MGTAVNERGINRNKVKEENHKNSYLKTNLKIQEKTESI